MEEKRMCCICEKNEAAYELDETAYGKSLGEPETFWVCEKCDREFTPCYGCDGSGMMGEDLWRIESMDENYCDLCIRELRRSGTIE
jgi:hypothetical protein